MSSYKTDSGLENNHLERVTMGNNVPHFKHSVPMNSDEFKKVIMSAPIFGGEDPPNPDDKKNDPPEVNPLAAQLEAANATNADLAAQLKVLQDAEDERARKDNSESENAKADLKKANTTIETLNNGAREMQSALEASVIENAILKFGKFQDGTTDFIVSKINRDIAKFEVKDGKASISNIDAELKRIAKENAFLIKESDGGNGTPPDPNGNGNQNGNGKTEGPRNPWASTAAAPPNAPNGKQEGAVKRGAMMNRYSAIGPR